MSAARLRSTAGSGLAALIFLPTVRKKTGVDVGVGKPTLDSELRAVLSLHANAICRGFGARSPKVLRLKIETESASPSVLIFSLLGPASRWCRFGLHKPKVLSFKKAPLATCRRTSSFDFAFSKRSAQRRGSLPKAGLNESGFLEKHGSPCHGVTRQSDVEQKGQSHLIRVAQRLEPSRRASPKGFKSYGFSKDGAHSDYSDSDHCDVLDRTDRRGAAL